jgi:hypothetical protein
LAQSSTYGASAGLSGGFTGDLSASVTNTRTRERSTTNAADSSHNASAAMSIKDWGSYATVNPFGTYPSWVFGQEFPWNAIECRFAANSDPTTQGTSPNPNQLPMIISNSMIANLFDGKVLYPPSELSICGVNFVMKASWRIYVDYTGSTEISLTSDINYFSASHQLAGKPKSVTVFMDQVPTTLSVSSNEMLPPSITLDLNIMALDPLGVNSDAAIVGFIPNKFIPPADSGVPNATSLSWPVQENFKIISATNDLIIEDTTAYPSQPIPAQALPTQPVPAPALAPTPTGITFTPSAASLPDSAPAGTTVAACAVSTSDGSQFTGTLAASPAGTVAISDNNLVLARALTPADDGPQQWGVAASQNGVTVSGSIAVQVTPSSPPPAPPPPPPPPPPPVRSGFTVSQTCLTASWPNGGNSPYFAYQITLYFKVIDSVSDYTLYIKHWITQSTGVTLSIVVNGDTTNTITKSVTALEAEGGENNLLSIALRDLDFASINSHDYLQLGLNSVQITMQPQAQTNCTYQIRAISITKED